MSTPGTQSSTTDPERPLQLLLALVVVAWGSQAIVTQSLLLREALVLMYGSELAWGIVLFAWLFGVAVGAAVGGRLAQRLYRAEIGLMGVLLGLSVVACLDLWVFRGARPWLGIEPGELLALPKTVLAALLFVSPAGAFVGMAFPFASSLRRTPEPRALARADLAPQSADQSNGILSLGTIYALESAGSLIGGAAFSFWAVEHLAPIQTAIISAVITAASLGALLGVGKRSPRAATVLAALAVAAFLLAVVAGDAMEEKLVQRRWRTVAPGYQLRAHVESKYQDLAIGQRAEQFTLYSNGLVTSDFPDPYTFVPLAHFWLCQHPQPHNVLVLGGGVEGLLAQILRHNVEHVHYVEPDPRQIQLIRPYMTDEDREALNDPRVTVHHLDARYFVKTQSARFDLVVARLPEPMSALAARFYTQEFYQELRRAMKPRSVLCMTAAATPGELSAVSAEYLASIRATLRQSFPHVLIGWGDPAHLFAATDERLISTDPATLAKRYIERSVESDWFDPVWFEGGTDWLDPTKVDERKAQLDDVVEPQISTDLRPVVYVQRLALWERMTSRTAHGVIERLKRVSLLNVVGGLLAISALTLLVGYIVDRFRGRRETAVVGLGVPRSWLSDGAIVLSIAGTGLVTMALSIIWLFAFQSLYGYVYQRIGWIIALFMAGLVLGCGLTATWLNRLTEAALREKSRKSPDATDLSSPLATGTEREVGSHTELELGPVPCFWQWLIIVDLLLAALSFIVPLILTRLSAMQATASALTLVESSISIMVALTGVLGGAAFAIAARLHGAMTGRAETTAGVIVGADHAGACVGALVAGILLVPVFGIAVTAWLLVGVKVGSALFLVAARRFSRAV